jgi:uncharacterized protein DUF2442
VVRVRGVQVRHDRVVTLEFTDGTRREVDLEPYLWGPVFEEIRTDPSLFREVRVQDGTIAWPNGADLAPETLYLGLPPLGPPQSTKRT